MADAFPTISYSSSEDEDEAEFFDANEYEHENNRFVSAVVYQFHNVKAGLHYASSCMRFLFKRMKTAGNAIISYYDISYVTSFHTFSKLHKPE